ncbi:MAG: hypothetical protein EXS69_01995 [Candidatus Zambryskibacteria bacterium]|nr:hypothetical protein [Candidatus Zambryskibacteria bacterium]
MRKTPLVEKEFYHIYNRGVDKRKIFSDKNDLGRFFKSMGEFNTIEPIGSIYEKSFDKKKRVAKPLVKFVAYCLNPNHFHFILEQVVDRGIEKFMHRLGTGYTKYFNEKRSRSGSLFQGRFKSSHINSNEYLLHVSAYVNLNYKVHKLVKGRDLYLSSWDEYLSPKQAGFCEKEITLGQFSSPTHYQKFAQEALVSIVERKELLATLELENGSKDYLEAQLPSLSSGRSSSVHGL